ncbi:hypothetical protein ABFT23_02335 [Nocardioides sp. C4-1]|uniref:hypothetical protein n=1 Tax=Nocardioides sp. C4-1 TaxID=3151851 RepID=UPI0032635826
MNAVHRALGAAVVGLGLGAGLLLGGAPAYARTPTTPPAPTAAPTTAPTTAPTDDETRAVFTGSFVRLPSITAEGPVQVRRYQVQVSQVFGPTQITTQRVTVRTRADLEACGTRRNQSGAGQSGAQQEQAGQSTATPAPTTPTTTAPPSTGVDKRPRLFDAMVDGTDYVVAGCAAAPIATEATIAGVEDKLGDGRPPGAVETPGTQLDDVGLLCPDTRDPIRLDDEGSCDSLDAGTSFTRNAAPGLAIVIVGGLGLLLARRLGRPRG